jgi:type VI secretion system protein ImpI
VASFGVQIRVSGPRGSFERWYERPPVFVGRRPTSDCLLDTQGVSKTHACIDIRSRALCIRDCGSANGTLVGGVLAEPHRWTRAAGLGEVVELRISEWTLHIAALPAAEVPGPSAATMTLTDMFEPPRQGAGGSMRPAAGGAQHTIVLGEQGARVFLKNPPAPGAQPGAPHPGAPKPPSVPPPAPLPFDPLYADLVRAQRTLYEAAAALLANAPPGHHRALCDQLAAAYPVMAKDPSFVVLLRHYGWTAPAQEVSLATSALDKIQELVRWYLGPDRAIANESELAAFKEHQRRALDELLIGFVKLVSGLDKFEQQMAIQKDAGAGGLSRSPGELIRQLLDWRLPADEALQLVRTSFADLMMHQVALLHGVMRGVKTLLAELSPATIEAVARDRRKKGLLPFGGPDTWAVYKERHADFSDEENERFRVLFGADFAEEYRNLARNAADPAVGTDPGAQRNPAQSGVRGSMPPPAGGVGQGTGRRE